MRRVLLQGGSWDGICVLVRVEINIYYKPARISVEEVEALAIDEATQWKHPEDVYVRKDKYTFVFDRRVNYKPQP